MSKILTLILAGFLCSLNVQAQTPQTADTLEFETVVVTASKIPLSLRETTKSVLIIDQEIISKSKGKNVAQLLQDQSGVIINNSYGTQGSNKGVYIQGALSKYALILIDGIPVSDPSGVGGALDLRLLSLSSVERVEIVKGSQSTLYGSDAIAGVINIITKKGEPELLNIDITASYGSFNTFESGIGINGSLNESISYLVNYNRETTDGISAAKDVSGTENFDKDGFNKNSFYSNLVIKPYKGISITPFINYSTNDGDFDSDAFLDGANTYELTLYNPGIRLQFLDEDFRLEAGYNFTKSENISDFGFGPSIFEGSIHNYDLFGVFSLTQNLKFLAGNASQYSILPGTGFSEKETAQLDSPYATLFLKDWYGINAELGYRYNIHSEYGTNSTISFAPSVNFGSSIRLMASIGSGFRIPTLSELYGPFGGNNELSPERSINFDIGGAVYLFEDKLRLESHYFQRSIEDVIVYTSTQGYLNRDEQNDYGIEIDAKLSLNENLRISGFYNFLDGEITQVNSFGNDTTFSNLVRRPKHSGGLRLDLFLMESLSISIQPIYMGERSDLFFFFDASTFSFSSREVTLEPYMLLNLYAEYSFLDNRATIFTDFKNILDKGFEEVYGYNTLGLSAKLGFRFKL